MSAPRPHIVIRSRWELRLALLEGEAQGGLYGLSLLPRETEALLSLLFQARQTFVASAAAMACLT